jgi:hypothetical protein
MTRPVSSNGFALILDRNDLRAPNMDLLSIPFILPVIVLWLAVFIWAPFQLARILYDGFKPLLRSAIKNPRFSVRTMFGATAVFAVAFTLLRMTGLFNHWHNSWDYFAAAVVLGCVSLVFAIGLACAISVLVSEVTIVFPWFKRRKEEDAPDLHFLEQMPDPPVARLPWCIAPDKPRESH